MTFTSSSPTDSRLESDVIGSRLTLDCVHLWWANLARAEPEIGCFHDLMSRAERDRAARFREVTSRRRFVAARGILRTLLGRYLDQDPAQVSLTVGCHGKPRLAGNQPTLYFNVSHADDLAVYAFAGECEVGVDLERTQEVAEWGAIADSLFIESERALLNSLADSDRTVAFIRAWTRHEALLKLQGHGLGGPRPATSAIFSFCPIDPPSGFAAALAIEGPPAVVLDAGFL